MICNNFVRTKLFPKNLRTLLKNIELVIQWSGRVLAVAVVYTHNILKGKLKFSTNDFIFLNLPNITSQLIALDSAHNIQHKYEIQTEFRIYSVTKCNAEHILLFIFRLLDIYSNRNGVNNLDSECQTSNAKRSTEDGCRVV